MAAIEKKQSCRTSLLPNKKVSNVQQTSGQELHHLHLAGLVCGLMRLRVTSEAQGEET